MADVFVSYAEEDRELARALATALEGRGWSVWWDRQLRAGERFGRVIQEEIKGARAVVVLWSRHSVLSDYVEAEATLGNKLRRLVPVALDDSEPLFVFQTIHTVRLHGWDGSTSVPGFRDLVESLRHRLDAAPAAVRGQVPKEAASPILDLDQSVPVIGFGLSRKDLSWADIVSSPETRPLTLETPKLVASSSKGGRLTWQAVANATSYVLERDSSPFFLEPEEVYRGDALRYALIGAGLPEGLRSSLEHWRPLSYYRLKATAASGAVESAWSKHVSVTST
jgi:hypothetical protein